ncbi:MAG: HesA/MoeB/ThiF family protein [Nanoarchaeota archaeon]|nr:HesA/MoeB/ThiF family protein [Nanoarchaeota archaeon]
MKVPFLLHGRENRYERHEIIFRKSGQKRISKSKVSIIGLGALGGIVSTIMARAGVGQIQLIDGDLVEFVNLHRQFLYNEDDVGQAKALCAKKNLEKINSDIKISYDILEVGPNNIDNVLKKKDLILNCTDNLYARFVINDYCRKKKLKWVNASAVRDIGCVMNFYHDKNSPCYRCLYENKSNELSCENSGVLNTLTTMVGAIQANEALKILLGKTPEKDMIRITLDSIDKIKFKRNQHCPLCSDKKFEFLDGKNKPRIKQSGGSVHFYGRSINLKTMQTKLKKHGKVEDYSDYLRFNNIIAFRDGRVIIRTQSEAEAKALYSKYFGSL